MLFHQHVADGVAVHAGGTGVERDAGGVERELVHPPRLVHRAPALLGVVVKCQARRAELGGDHVLGAQHREELGDVRVVGHAGTHRHRQVDRLLHQLVALQLDLATAHIQRRDDLVVG